MLCSARHSAGRTLATQDNQDLFYFFFLLSRLSSSRLHKHRRSRIVKLLCNITLAYLRVSPLHRIKEPEIGKRQEHEGHDHAEQETSRQLGASRTLIEPAYFSVAVLWPGHTQPTTSNYTTHTLENLCD